MRRTDITRGQRPAPRDRVKRWLVAVNPEERETISAKARDAGKPISTYMRECALGAAPRSKIYAEVRCELLRVAGLVGDGAVRDALIQAARRLA